MRALQKAADVVQKGAVVGLMSLFGYQVYQIGRNLSENKVEHKYQNTKIMDKINEKVAEEDRKKGGIDTIPDRYDPEDDSYKKNLPKLNSSK